MRSIAKMFFAGSLATVVVLSSFTAVSSAQEKTGQVEVMQDVKHDTSPPLSELIKGAPEIENLKREVHPLRRIPLPPKLKPADVADPVLQNELLGPAKESPGTIRNFDGVGNHFHDFSPDSVPSDTDGAVGTTQYVQVVNASFAIFNKADGALLAGPTQSKHMWKGFGGGCENDNDGDAIVLHDTLANRWVFTQFATQGTPFLECVAVSTSEDALGTYHRFAFHYNNFPDYPKLGVWPDAYYATFNMFQGAGGPFVGAKACAFDRAAMLAGNAATQQCFQQSDDVGGLLPANFEGGTPPPHGEPNFVVNFGSNALNLFKFHVDFQHPANSKFTGPKSISVAPFTPLCDGGTCVKQPSGSELDSLADRLMQPLAYRNFGDHEALVVVHSVAVGSGGGIRWYEIRDPDGTPHVHQQGTFAQGGFRWMPSIGINKAGDIAVGYSVSSGTVSPSIAFNGRIPADPSGKLESETMIVSGGGSQTSSAGGRWGDYSSMHIDPSDDCTFWYTGEYMRATGEFNWHTRIANFRFPGCGGGASCGKGEAFCSEKCVNINDDRDNCGQCGHNCASGKTCQGGVCKSCPAGTTFCGDECVNLQTSNENCGKCGNECIGIGKCTAGECVTHCPGSNQICCSGELAYCAKTCTLPCQP